MSRDERGQVTVMIIGFAAILVMAVVVVVDASALVRFDSATLALLLEMKRLALSFDRPFELRDAPARLVQLASVYGVDSLVGVAEDVRV